MSSEKPRLTETKKKRPWAAPGNEEILELPATREEKQRGDFTRVTTLSFDEVNPS